MHRDLVPRCDDLARERRPLHDLLTDEEERCRRPAPRELLEHRRRSLRMGPVVERHDDDRTIDPALELQPVRESWHVGGERRCEPDHATSASTSEAAEGIAASTRPGARRLASAPRSA
jgi:hypothetical protein